MSATRLLDLGAGFGRYIRAFGEFIPQENLYAMEPDHEGLSSMRNQGFSCSDAGCKDGRIPHADKTFSIILAMDVFEHMPRPSVRKFLSDIYRTLCDGGRLVITCPNYPAKRFYNMWKALTFGPFWYYLVDDPTHFNKMYYSTLRSLLREEFSVVHMEATDIVGERWLSGWRWFVQRYRHRLMPIGDKVIDMGSTSVFPDDGL